MHGWKTLLISEICTLLDAELYLLKLSWEILNSEAIFHADLQAEFCIHNLQESSQGSRSPALSWRHLEVLGEPGQAGLRRTPIV